MALTTAQPNSHEHEGERLGREIRRRANLARGMTSWEADEAEMAHAHRVAWQARNQPNRLINTQGSTWAGRQHPRFAR
jgi:hypothetical protein